MPIEIFDERRRKRLVSEWSTSYQPRQPIASDLHDCSRYQVIRIVGWKVREVPPQSGLEVIEDGRLLEAAIMRQLADEGWEIVEQQAPIDIRQPLTPGGPRKLLLTGKSDGKIRLEKGARPVPLEIKATSEHVFEAIDDEQDLRDHSVWTRKWWRQMQVYLLGAGVDHGVLVLGFRGHRKAIRVSIDYDEGERLLQLTSWAVATTEAALEDGADEATIDAWLDPQAAGPHAAYLADQGTCRRCPFRDRACFPPDKASGIAQVRADLEPTVARWLELKPLASEKDRLQKILKAETEGFPQTVAGSYVVEGEVKTRKMKEQPAKPAFVSEYWAFDAHRVGDAPTTEETSQ